MNILIIYAHPSKKSYTFQILEQLQALLWKEKWTVKCSDLYKMNFQTDMTEEEYEREGLLQPDLLIPADVQEEHKKIEWADGIIFLYPVWWSDCPAKLKGWFDRVYSLGYAYGNYGTSKMKLQRFGIAVCTAGHPNEFLTQLGIAESMRNVMIDDRLGKRFQHKELVILGGTLDINSVRKEHSSKLVELIDTLRTYASAL